ncbi:Uncharacterized conserved protein (DUF2196) [Seminavis robusta]|uniref:Uncharacterized conserved protein (DUF2196) n=1 Tax=Seminavis robusta TaxID=568900 RepID=A0A9N8DZH7_9STRA|nr:Uncharacterized conserved protein (DUF2196) [Seminavis robusta]|eukprot:Sro502_g155490.1 Uncharacterized conserved protein (DUF2196) (181) ;mRNA; f:4718-5260
MALLRPTHLLGLMNAMWLVQSLGSYRLPVRTTFRLAVNSISTNNKSLPCWHTVGFFRQPSACFMVRRNYRTTSSRNEDKPGRPDRRQRSRRGRPRSPPPPMPPPGSPGRGCFKELIKPGLAVLVVQKSHQRSGEETRGEVDRLLTNSRYHPRGIKVMLVGGIVGRVTRIASEEKSTDVPP